MDVGFIILRHVNSNQTNEYWIHCYECIRKFYPEHKIMIIDDNSKCEFITNKELYKTTIIHSEYPGRGELLPYYYYLHNKLFDTAVILHDSAFINSYMDFNSINKYKILWEFEHNWDQLENELEMISLFKDAKLLKIYHNKEAWKGCFGGMAIIQHNYLVQVNHKYDISKLLECVKTRFNRCSFERVIACLLQCNVQNQSLLGNIHKYGEWGITYSNKNKYAHLPIIKVWTGR
tara:strand:+ start:1979 stop:2677 length:699 start_codon:yes stop_codon:yes gene_type:complete